MSDKKTTPKAKPNYTRIPASLLTLQHRVDALYEYSDALLNLIVSHLPALQQPAQQLAQTMQGRLAQIKANDGALILQGHGTRGVLLSQGITTEKQNKAFTDSLPKPAENPLTINQLMGELQNYLMIDQITPEGIRRGWVLPDAENFSALMHDLEGSETTELTEQPDGLYVAAKDGQGIYTLKLTIGEDILIFTPSNGPLVLTYSTIEQAWIGHTAYQFLDGAVVLEAIRKFFNRANVHDVTPGELKKLDAALRKLPEAKLRSLAVLTGETVQDIEIQINDLFKVRLPADAEPSIVGVRDDISWTELTSYTRRQLFRTLTRRVGEAASGPAPKPVKKSAKK